MTEQSRIGTWSNWSGETVYENTPIYRPHSGDDLTEAIADARSTHRVRQIRAVGAGHSWVNIGLAGSGDGAIINTDCLDRILGLEQIAAEPGQPKTARAKVEGGARLYDLNRRLFDLGYSLDNLGDTDHQSIAGAISTDTHGSGGGIPSLSAMVEGIELVDADGNLIDLQDDNLKAGRVSLGALGVIYSVTLRVRERLYLKQVRDLVNIKDQLEDLGELRQRLAANRNLEYWFFPYTRHADRITRNEIPLDEAEKIAAEQGRALGEYHDLNVNTAREGAVLDLQGQDPQRRFLLPGLFKLGVLVRRLDGPEVRVGPSHMILPLVAQSTVSFLQTRTMEYLFDLEHLGAAFQILEDTIRRARRKDVYISVPIHIRFVAESRKDKSFLSPCTDPISASISVNFSRNYEGFDVWFRDFEQRLLDAGIGARTHLGKIHFQPPEIPPEFMAVRDALDPEGLFKNFGNVYEG